MARRLAVWSVAGAALVGGAALAYTLVLTGSVPGRVEPPTFAPETTLPATDQFAALAQTDPVGMYEACLSRYAHEVKGFRATLEKQERVHGKLHDREIIRVAVAGEVPATPGAQPALRVRMVWQQGFQKDFLGNEVRASLYVAGQNDDHMVVWRPTAAFLKAKQLGPRDTLARDASRYCVTTSGLYGGMLRSYATWKKRKEACQLRTEYLGTQVIEKAGGRVCHVIRRTCPQPEVDPFALDEQAPTDPKTVARDGAAEITVMIDAGRWVQVGSVLKRAGGDLLGEYYFRDVELLTADLPDDTFTVDAMKAAAAKK